jgi:3-deoxy-D-manno-octulosonate 8-phosphate phosphatase (KDO 8-P phosphatase)
MEKASTIELLVLDVDGVLTDGVIVLDDLGHEGKAFFARDGLAIRLALESGLGIAMLTGRTSQSVALRATELRVPYLAQAVSNKAAGVAVLQERAGVGAAATAMMGDDLVDLPAMRQCAYSLAPSDAVPEVKRRVHHAVEARGGRGAVREAVEHVMRAQGRWERAVSAYLSS